MPTLHNTWPQIAALLESGLSLVPVRDKQQGEKPAKTPFTGWKDFQTRLPTAADLFSDMDRFDTTAVAIICGRVSGNLEIIDIDVKYKPGIDAVLLSDIKTLYPDIFKRLRIHKTPSGGYHILYRIQDPPREFPGNQKLAGRNATTEELEANPRGKTRNFLETRGEGGYAVAPPSMGYSVSQDLPIPVLSWEERCSLITLCKMYTEIAPVADIQKPSRRDTEYYSTNPFDHFNNSQAGAEILEKNGWKQCGHNNKFVWFTRPGKDKGVSASFNLQKRVYFIFTSSTDFDESRGYNPATVLSILQHGGDRKKTHAWLVQEGYGIIRPEVEKRIAEKNALSGRPLPANTSASARAEYDTKRALLQSTYPYGIFWQYTEEGRVKISREHLYTVADGLGFRVYKGDPVRISGFTVTKIPERQLWDTLKAYIKEEDGDEYLAVCNAFEAFVQTSGKFTITRLADFDTNQLVRDTSHTCYKYFTNGYLFITPQDYSFNTYDTLGGLIWSDQILQRPFHIGEPGGKYVDFLQLAIVGDPRLAIGFLAHEFKDETTGYIITLTEQCPDPKQGGGSGKNVFSNLLKQVTTFKTIPGAQIKYDEKFLNIWNGERVLAISDVPKSFDFTFLKDMTTNDGVQKKLFKDEFSIPVDEMPKFVIQTNYSYTVSDGGLARRIIAIEFTDYFTRKGGVDVHFGCHFPKGWELSDWTGFDNYVAGCIRDWMAGGLKLQRSSLTETGWQKQFEHTYGHAAAGAITECWKKWQEAGFVSNEAFRQDLEAYYRDNSISVNFRPSMTKINDAIRAYASHYNLQYAGDQFRREMGIAVKGRVFGPGEDLPF